MTSRAAPVLSLTLLDFIPAFGELPGPAPIITESIEEGVNLISREAERIPALIIGDNQNNIWALGRDRKASQQAESKNAPLHG